MSSPRKQKDPYDERYTSTPVKTSLTEQGTWETTKADEVDHNIDTTEKAAYKGKNNLLLIVYLNGAVHNWRSLG